MRAASPVGAGHEPTSVGCRLFSGIGYGGGLRVLRGSRPTNTSVPVAQQGQGRQNGNSPKIYLGFNADNMELRKILFSQPLFFGRQSPAFLLLELLQ